MVQGEAGASFPSETMMHFPPLFQIPPYFRKMFRLSGKLSQFYLFPKNFLIFIRRNFWWLFLVINHKFRIPPIFPVSVHFPLFRKKYYFPLLLQIFPTSFKQIHRLFTYFTCISFPPYFDYDAFMHHPMHVLDAPEGRSRHMRLTLDPNFEKATHNILAESTKESCRAQSSTSQSDLHTSVLGCE